MIEAVVMAAGEGRRLRPLTERWPKPVLPIDGRPVIATLLRELAAAGFDSATVVVGHLAPHVEALLEDGAGFGLRLRYALQSRPLGSADAVRQALAAGTAAPVVVTAADMVFSSGDVGRACARWRESGTPGGLGVRGIAPAELREQSLVRVEQGLVAAIGGPPQRRGDETLTGAPLWFLGPELAGSLERLPGPPYELATAFQAAIDAGQEILALELGPTRDLTRPEDVIMRNFPYLLAWGKPGFPHEPPS